jgi:hypothetical protein
VIDAGLEPNLFEPRSAAAELPPMRFRRAAARTWWTRDRVIAGLRRFHRDHDLAPTSTEEWHQITRLHGQRGGGHGGRRRYPSLYAVLRHFDTFRQAWAAAGIDVGRRQESWRELEDWYLREGLGLIPRTELARDLNRTPDAIHRRLYDLGLHSYQRWGWTLHRVERVAQVPRHRLQTYLERGDLPYLRGSKCVYVDPADLVVVEEIDWQNPPRELRESALQAWRPVPRAAVGPNGSALEPKADPARTEARRGCAGRLGRGRRSGGAPAILPRTTGASPSGVLVGESR